MTNSIQVATINSIGDFILFLGKIAVGSVCGLISILILRQRDDVQFYVVPCVLIAIFAFFIAHIILSLFEVRSHHFIHSQMSSIILFLFHNFRWLSIRCFCVFVKIAQ